MSMCMCVHARAHTYTHTQEKTPFLLQLDVVLTDDIIMFFFYFLFGDNCDGLNRLWPPIDSCIWMLGSHGLALLGGVALLE